MTLYFLRKSLASSLPPPMGEPGVLHARIEAERHAGEQREGRVLAEIVVAGGVAHLDGAVGGGVQRLQAGHDLAGREHLDLELVVGHLGDRLGEHLRGREQRVERLREARREAPFDLRRRTGRSPARRARPTRRRRCPAVFTNWRRSIFSSLLTQGACAGLCRPCGRKGDMRNLAIGRILTTTTFAPAAGPPPNVLSPGTLACSAKWRRRPRQRAP